MEFAILIFGLLAILHFVYEGIVAPSSRLEQKYKLFALRDEIRMLKISRRDQLAKRHFDYVQDSINGLLHNVERIDLTMLVALALRRAHDKEFRERVAARAKTLDDCPIVEPNEVRARAFKIIEHILAINNLAWVFYVIPILLAAVCYRKAVQLLKAVTTLSQLDIDKVAIPSPGRLGMAKVRAAGRH